MCKSRLWATTYSSQGFRFSCKYSKSRMHEIYITIFVTTFSIKNVHVDMLVSVHTFRIRIVWSQVLCWYYFLVCRSVLCIVLVNVFGNRMHVENASQNITMRNKSNMKRMNCSDFSRLFLSSFYHSSRHQTFTIPFLKFSMQNLFEDKVRKSSFTFIATSNNWWGIMKDYKLWKYLNFN